MQRYKLERSQSARLARLLHMEYTPGEIADELGCTRRKIRRAINAGCPHRQTDASWYRIVGDQFRDWYQEIIRQRKRPLGPNEAYCLGCRKTVPLPANAEVVALPNGAQRVTAPCPTCGATVNRFRGSAS